MELRHLRYFLAVAEECNFTRAAARLGMSQPPLSQQMRDLETELGVPLFDRLAQGVALTEAGRVFLAEARSMLERAERAKALARRAGEGTSGMLRLGVTATASFNPVPAAMIRDFRRTYQDVSVSIDEGRSIRLVERLLNHELDAVFVRPSPAFPSSLDLTMLDHELLVAALPDDHPMAGLRRLELADLAGESFILLGKSVCSSFHDAVLQACRAAGFDPVVAHEAGRLTSIIDMVASGLGIALVPASLAGVGVPAICFREIADNIPSVPLALATARDAQSAVLANFVAAARQRSGDRERRDRPFPMGCDAG